MNREDSVHTTSSGSTSESIRGRPMGRTQRQLADQISRDVGIPTRTGQRFLQQLLDLVANDLVETKRVELRGLGIFAIHHRPKKKTIHPKTGKPITIPACDTVEYRSSIALRRRLNPKQTATSVEE